MIPLISAQSNPGGGILLAPYTAQGIDLDGSSRWLNRTSDLIGASDGKKGIFYARLKMDASMDGNNGLIFRGGAGRIQILTNPSDKLEIKIRDSVGATKLEIASTTAYTSSDGWLSFMASWDMAVPNSSRLYVKYSTDRTVVTFLDATLDYTNAEWQVGSNSAGGSFLWDGCIADLYWNQDAYLDFDTVSNRRKYTDADDKPVDLGPTGANPTGLAPIAFFSGPVVDWQNNLGTGGAFIENGTLVACATNP